MFGILEAGGTKMICAVGNKDLEIKDQARFDTRGPVETFADIKDFLQNTRTSLSQLLLVLLDRLKLIQIQPTMEKF